MTTGWGLARGACALCALACGQAAAEPNTNLARAVAPESGYFAVEQAATIASGALHVGAIVDAGRRLLVVRDPMTDAIVPDGEIVAARLALHLAASLGVTERFELSSAMSFAVQRGDGAVDRPAVQGAALGDLRLRGKLRLWQRGGFALAGALEVSLPTSSSDAMFGDDAMSATPMVIAGAAVGAVELAAQAGYRIRSASRYRDLAVDDEIVAGVAARYPLAKALWAQVELDGARGVQAHGNKQPIEALAGLRYRVDARWLAQVGAGLGLGHGYGAPEIRGLVMIGYAPIAAAAPARVAWMPSETDEEDAPSIGALPPEIEIEPTYRVVGDRIVLSAEVLFALDSATVQDRGREVLAEIARDWQKHPEWAEMTVEGHADVRGAAAANQRLSEQRAQQVRAVLIELGGAPERLHAMGFGATRPLTQGATEADHARNRRVEIVITRRRVED